MNLRIVYSAKMGIFFSYQLNDLALCILNHLLFFLLSAFFESILLALNFSLLIFSLPCWIRDNLEFSYLINS